jgi:hypothetical protein
MGGDPSNCSFPEWAPTVPSNPVPVGYDLDEISALLTSDNFPNDPAILAKKLALRLATHTYVQTNGTLPGAYCADVSATAGVPSHFVPIMHMQDVVPTYVQVQSTMTVDRMYSRFYPLEWAHDPSETNNFYSLAIDEQTVRVITTGDHNLAGNFDASTNKWQSSNVGYWSVASLSRVPDHGGNWINVSEGQQAVALASAVDPDNVTLVQVQFAENTEPIVAYPLVWRWADQRQGLENPRSISIEGGQVMAQFVGGTSVFTTYDLGVNNWLQFSSGYFRTTVFTMKADFNSGWVVSPPAGAAAVVTAPHGLNIVPEIVQVYLALRCGRYTIHLFFPSSSQSMPCISSL